MPAGTTLQVSTAHGGCGVVHIVSDEGQVTCQSCEPFLVKSVGAATQKKDVAKTPDEIKEQDELGAEGARIADAMMAAFATIAATTAANEKVADVQSEATVAARKAVAKKSTGIRKAAPRAG